MLTVYSENTYELGKEWNHVLACEFISWEDYGFTFKRISSIELLTPRQIRALYGFITDEDMEYIVLTTETNLRIYIQHDPKNIFMSFTS